MIFLLLKKQFRVVAVACLVQLLGVVAVSLLEPASLWKTVQVNWKMVGFHAVQPGVHLGYLLRDYPQASMWLVAAITVVTLGLVVRSRLQGWMKADVLAVNSVMILWILLAVYHRNYDTLAVIAALVLLLSAATTWQLPPRHKFLLICVWLVVVFIMCLPGDILEVYIAHDHLVQFKNWVEHLMTLAIALLWASNLWLLFKTPRVEI